jgi:hypothetical protein
LAILRLVSGPAFDYLREYYIWLVFGFHVSDFLGVKVILLRLSKGRNKVNEHNLSGTSLDLHLNLIFI